MTTISSDLSVSSDRNIYSAIVNASTIACETFSWEETTQSNIAILYADMSNAASEAGNAILEDDCQAIEDADDDDVSAANAENSKDSNALSQSLSTYTSWMDRVSSMESTVSQNQSNVFTITESVLSSLSTIISVL